MGEKKSKLATVIRVTAAVIAILLQITLFAIVTTFLRQYAAIVYTILQAVSVIVAIYISSRRVDSSYKLAWISAILLLSVFGVLLYFAWGNSKVNKRLQKKMREARERILALTPQDEDTKYKFEEDFPEYIRASRHLRENGFPIYGSGSSKYYPLGEPFFDALIEDMLSAKEFIFLEYFIIANGKIWDVIYDVLVRKVAEGVEIRILYDDGGSLFTVHSSFKRELEADGIEVRAFNPVQKFVSNLNFNYRNHQKIAVIDGRVGYTGGINIGDEYANLYSKHGHWKDTAIRLEGDVVGALLATFLEMWFADGGDEEEDYDKYILTKGSEGKGYYQFFADGPVNNPSNPAENTYISIIGSAKNYIYITTPYLIIDDGMAAALINAAESGVDVRIITPKHGDHWYVHETTRSYYEGLIRYGVRIFEYTPGFIHAKMLVSDGNCAVIGTINMDFRSFFLHYECAVMLCGTDSVDDIRDDIIEILNVSEEIKLEEYSKRPLHIKLIQSALNLFSPLM